MVQLQSTLETSVRRRTQVRRRVAPFGSFCVENKKREKMGRGKGGKAEVKEMKIERKRGVSFIDRVRGDVKTFPPLRTL